MPEFRDDNNPSSDLFRVLGLVSLGGLLALILADRLMFPEVIQGRNLIIIAMSLIPIMVSALGALLMFRISFSVIEKQHSEREAARQQYLKDIEHSYQSVMIALVAALDSRDHQAIGHSHRVVAYSQALGAKLDLSPSEQRDLLFGGYLHDIGKIGMEDKLLRKTSSLSEAEWEEMRQHPRIAINILNDVDFLNGASDVILHHHERFDGQGYPGKLSGPDIPLLARVFAVADAFDAMTMDRPYRKAITVDHARQVIRKESGRQFCPACVEAFLSFSLQELGAIRLSAEEGRRDGSRREADAPEESPRPHRPRPRGLSDI